MIEFKLEEAPVVKAFNKEFKITKFFYVCRDDMGRPYYEIYEAYLRLDNDNPRWIPVEPVTLDALNFNDDVIVQLEMERANREQKLIEEEREAFREIGLTNEPKINTERLPAEMDEEDDIPY